MNLEDKKLWSKLYEVAEKIQKLEPWNYLIETDLLMYLSEEANDIFYCSVMGQAGLHRALAIYKGSQINGLLDIMENDYPNHMIINYQECLVCHYASRDYTSNKNREIIKELGLKFRGTWISFECFEKGYEPSVINIGQVKMLIDALENFYMIFKTIIDGGLKIDFESGETVARHYDKDKKLYLTYPTELLIPEKEYNAIGVNIDLLEDIIKMPQTDMEIEYDFLNYVPLKVRNSKEKDGRCYYPKLRIMADRKTGFIISNDIIDKNNYKTEKEYVIESLKELMDKFSKIGRPKSIYVRDMETKMYLKDMCDKLSIKIIVKPRLKAIDELYNALSML